MGIVNKASGTLEPVFFGRASVSSGFQMKVTDRTNFMDTNLKSNYRIDAFHAPGVTTVGPNTQFIGGDNGFKAELTGADAIAGNTVSGSRGYLVGNDDFDFRWKLGSMDIEYLNVVTSANIIGVTADLTLPFSSGGFYFSIEGAGIVRRTLSVIFIRPTGFIHSIYSITEASLGQFGTAVDSGKNVSGNFLHSCRIARSGNMFIAEWNYYSDLVANPGFDSNEYIKTYKNRITYYPDNGANSNNGAPTVFDVGVSVYPSAFCYIDPGSGTELMKLRVLNFRSVPAVCIDTTNQHSSVDLLTFGGDSIQFLTDEHGEGYADVRITQLSDSSVYVARQAGDVIKFERNSIVSGRKAQYLFDNKLNTAKTNDLKNDIYIDSVYKFPKNNGSITPLIYTDIGKHRADKTYSIYVNKDGYLSNFDVVEDNTDFNSTNNSDIKSRTKLVMGRHNPPTYMFNDSTHLLGRNAKFNFLDQVLLTATAGETPAIDQYRVFERDTTSYYIMEVVSDGTFFIVHSRIFNPYTKTLTNRVRVNSDITIYASNPTFAPNVRFNATFEDYFLFTYRNYKPNPSIMTFPNKHICALTVNTATSPLGSAPAGLSYRLFFETLDQGSTWIYRAQNNRNFGKAGEQSHNGDTVTFKIPGNDNYFFNFLVNQNVAKTFFHRADNFAMRPSNGSFVDLLKFSRIADQTVFYVHACYDPIQENIAVALSAINGQLEIIRSPRIRKETMHAFNITTQQESWKSEYLTKPFADGMVGKTYISIDKGGDLVALVNKRNDDTSFAILRTSQNGDDLNMMGRFMQSSYKAGARLGRSLTNMFMNKNGDIVMSSAARNTTSALQIVVNIAKYGMLTNIPTELDYGEGVLAPQVLDFDTAIATFDTTTSGILLATGISRFAEISTAVGTVTKSISSTKRGFKAEWQSFVETPDAAVNTNSQNILFSLVGNQLTATTVESVYFRIGWDSANVWAKNFLTPFETFDRQPLDPRKLRRYMMCAERTTDSSAAIVLYTENLEMSNHDKIIWDKKLSFVTPIISSVTITDHVSWQIATAGRTAHVVHTAISRADQPLQPQRNGRLKYASENMIYRDVTNLSEYNGIPATSDMTSSFSDGIKINWSGQEGVNQDKWNFNFGSATKPNNLVDKEPFKFWRSVGDNTSSVVVFDATDQGYALLRANVAVFANANFRRCFVEGHTSSLLDANTVASYSREIFFDLDNGVVVYDATNYGNSSVIPCEGKSWRPNEHAGRYVQFESARLDGTAFRHIAFKVIENGPDSLTIFSGPQRFDTTNGFRYTIYDGSKSLPLNDATSFYNFWRIRIPPHQTRNAATPTDETAQGSVYREPYRELGEFDLGRLTELDTNFDDEVDISIQSDVKTTEFDNLSTVNFEFARSRRTKRVKYSNASVETLARLKTIFSDLYGSSKTLWVFEDQEKYPRAFMLARITNEPEVEEVNDQIQSVTIEFEEVI